MTTPATPVNSRDISIEADTRYTFATGYNAVVLTLLTNNSVVSADSSGTVTTLPSGNVATLYVGSTALTSNVAYSVVAPANSNGVTLAIGSTTGIITLTGTWSTASDTELWTISAVYNGITYSTQYRITKAKGGAAGAGSTSVSAVLTNDSAIVGADSSGTVPTGGFAGAITQMVVFVGSSDDSTNWTYTVTYTNLSVSSTSTARLQTVTGFTGGFDYGYLEITASKATYSNITKRFTVTKVRTGTAGISYWLVVSSAALKRSTTNVYTPTSLIISSMSQTGAATPAVFSAIYKIYENGTLVTTTAASTANYTYTPTVTTLTTVKVELYLSDGTSKVDEQSIPIVLDGTTAYSLTIPIYLQGSSVTVPSGGSYTFTGDSFAAPSGGWSRTLPTGSTTPTWVTSYLFTTQTPGTAVAGPTPWATPVKFVQDGATGPSGITGQSNYRAYAASTYGTPPTTPSGVGFPPTGSSVTWSPTPVTLSTGQSQYQVDGVQTAGASTITWGTPYLSYFKVANLGAIGITTGALTVDDALTLGTNGYIVTSGGGYGTGGVFLGYHSASSTYRFSVGGMTFDGTKLTVPVATFGGVLGSENLLPNSDFAYSGQDPTTFEDIAYGYDLLYPGARTDVSMSVGGNGYSYACGTITIEALADLTLPFGFYTNTSLTSPANPITGDISTSGGVGAGKGWHPLMTYVVSFWSRDYSGSSGVDSVMGNIQLLWRQADVPVSTTAIYNPILTGDWQFYAFRVTCGTFADWMGELCISVTGSVPTGVRFRISGLKAEVGEYPTGWCLKATELGMGRISYDHLDTNVTGFINNKLSKTAADILTGPISLGAPNAITVGTPSLGGGTGANGLYLGSSGIVGTKNGNATFTIDATTGDATFAGDLIAATGTLHTITLTSGGNIKAGKTSFASSTSGFYLGYDATATAGYKFNLGDATNYLNWSPSGGLNFNGTINGTATIAGTTASTVVSNAAAGASASSTLPGKLSKSGTDILTGPITFSTDKVLVVGSPALDSVTGHNGLYLGNTGIVGTKNGVATFTIDATTGSATFAGDLTAATGTLDTITLTSGGNIKAGKSAFADYSTSGFFLGYDGAATAGYKFNIGNISSYLSWSPSNGLTILNGLVNGGSMSSTSIANCTVDGNSTINGTQAATVVTGAASGAAALSGLSGKLSKTGGDILSGTIGLDNTVCGIAVGTISWDGVGVPTTGTKGIAITQNGILGYNGSAITFSINKGTGNALFAGTLSAAHGSLGDITLDTATSNIKAGKTTYSDGTSGFYLGYDATATAGYKFNLGDSSNYLNWSPSGGLVVSGAITSSSTIAGTSAATVVSNASAGAGALTSKLNKSAADTITGTITLGAATALQVGSPILGGGSGASGFYLGSTGIVAIKDGVPTVTILNTGDATFYGTLSAAHGSLGDITLDATTGNIKAGKTSFASNIAGFYLGYDAAATAGYKFNLGDATTYLKWSPSGGLEFTGNVNGTIAGTSASIVVSNAAAGASTATTKLNKSGTDILSAILSLDTTTVSGIRVSDATTPLVWDISGNRTSGKGIAITQRGIVAHNGTAPTFTLDAVTGNAVFGGTISVGTVTNVIAQCGSYSGVINAFSQSVIANTQSFTMIGTPTPNSKLFLDGTLRINGSATGVGFLVTLNVYLFITTTTSGSPYMYAGGSMYSTTLYIVSNGSNTIIPLTTPSIAAMINNGSGFGAATAFSLNTQVSFSLADGTAVYPSTSSIEVEPRLYIVENRA